MTRHRRFGLALLAAPWLLASPSGADQVRGVDSEMFRPTLDSYGVITVDSAQTGHQWDFGFKLTGNYAQAPLKLDIPGIDGSPSTVIDSAASFDFGVHLALTQRIEFGFDVPVTAISLGAGYGVNQRTKKTGFFAVDPGTNVAPSTGNPGDVRIGFKARLLNAGSVRIGGAVTGSVPFGDEQNFTGDQSFTVEPKLILDHAKGPLLIAANVGARFRKRTTVKLPQTATTPSTGNCDAVECTVLDVGNEGTMGLGIKYGFSPTLGVAAEAFGTFPIAGKDATLEALGAVNIALRSKGDAIITLGGGKALLTSAHRSNDFRVFAGVAWTPSPEVVAVGQMGSRADRDGDGIPDALDACPDQPEDKDGFQDADGCPDLDNDQDGIPDADDKCPNEAEDRDGYQDKDGCPDPDNDHDGIPDVADNCPNDPEDKDGFQDTDGCPDLDNDGDGIPDAVDKCPNEPETFNGIEDADGCPDTGTQTGPEVKGSIIDLKGDKIDFAPKTANLDKTTAALLDQVAELLKQKPKVRVRVEAHTEVATKPAEAKAAVTLSEQRANAVRNYLIGKGVNGNRIATAGYGGARPIAPTDTPANREKNRRVELIVLEQ